MAETRPSTTHVLSALIAVLAAATSAAGLLVEDMYRDNALVTAGWYGNDLVTLVAVIPALVTTMVLSARGSQRAQLVWLGLLDYMLYNYAFYLFGAAFNRSFLLYVAIFTLSGSALVVGLMQIDATAIARMFRPTTPVAWIGAYLLLIGVGLTAVYTAQTLEFILLGHLPKIVTSTGHPTSVVFALDLSIVVPVLLLGAVWVWKRKPWGYVLATITSVKGAAYMLALSAATVAGVRTGAAEDLSQVALWGAIGAASFVATVVLLRNMRRAEMPTSLSPLPSWDAQGPRSEATP